MLLPELTEIDLETFERASLSFVELSYLEIPAGASVLDPRFEDDVATAIENFSTWVVDRFDEEPAIRVAIAYLLNLDDERFGETIRSTRIHFTGDLPTLRAFLERLWEATFADWRIPRFDPDAYRLKHPHKG